MPMSPIRSEIKPRYKVKFLDMSETVGTVFCVVPYGDANGKMWDSLLSMEIGDFENLCGNPTCYINRINEHRKGLSVPEFKYIFEEGPVSDQWVEVEDAQGLDLDTINEFFNTHFKE